LVLWNKSQIANRKSQIANRKSQTINNSQSFFDYCTDAMHRVSNLLQRNKLISMKRDTSRQAMRREASRLYMILIMICISINTYSQGNLNITLLPKTYVGNYNLSCNGGNNGEIDVLITGGTAPYTLVWNNNSTANPLLNLNAGTYSVTLTDAANATVQASVTLIEPPALGYNLEVSQFGEYNLQYFGSTLGTIKINSSGGTPSYLVVWSDNNTELIRDSLAAGTYSFILTDANGCTLSGNKTLTQPAVLSGTATQLQAVSCFEGEDGKAQITASGGIAPYHYLWDNGSFSATPEDLRAGVHEVHITDDADNTLTLQVTITEPTAIDVQISKSNYPNNFNVSCYNCFNGTIDAVASGGTAPYTFEWIWQENSIGTTANLSNLGGGDYNLIISDQNNCRYRGEVNLKEPERQDWGMSGNAGTDPATQFIGTTDSVDVVFRSNNAEIMRFSSEKVLVPGKLMVGPSGIISSGENNGNVWFHVGANLPGGPQGILQDVCYPSNLGKGRNIFEGMLQTINPYSPSNASGGSLMMGSAGLNASIEVVSYGTNNNQPYVSSAPPVLKINANCGHDTYVGNNNAGNLIIEHALGIHTTSPQTPLHVEGTTYLNGNVGIAVAAPEAGLHNAGMSIFENKVGIGQSFTALNAEASLLQVNGKAKFKEIYVEDANAPANGFLVQVNGKIRTKEIVVEDINWPDYVYEEGYSLLPLPDFAAYIQQNKHLPNIPSALEIKESGLPLAEMSHLQMQSIEVLSLYIIQLNEKLEAMQKELDSLKKK
jgi:hypothetical protein